VEENMTPAHVAATELDPGTPPAIGTVERALWLVRWHVAWENPEQLEQLGELYDDDIIWEVPARRTIYRGKKEVLENYRRIFESVENLTQNPIDRYATVDRCFDDMEATFLLTDSKGFPNHPLPVGTRIAMRLTHSFHIKDGLITREIAFEQWRPDISY
jgi:hypothetical protein